MCTARRIWCCPAVCLITVVAAAGCGRSHPTTVAVRGQITLEGGQWPTGGKLYFNPVKPAAGFPGHSGTADFTTDGRFAVGTWERTDGLMPGKYKVGVECWKVPPTMAGPGVSYAADLYLAAACCPIELTVEAGKPLTGLNWDIPRNPGLK